MPWETLQRDAKRLTLSCMSLHSEKKQMSRSAEWSIDCNCDFIENHFQRMSLVTVQQKAACIFGSFNLSQMSLPQFAHVSPFLARSSVLLFCVLWFQLVCLLDFMNESLRFTAMSKHLDECCLSLVDYIWKAGWSQLVSLRRGKPLQEFQNFVSFLSWEVLESQFQFSGQPDRVTDVVNCKVLQCGWLKGAKQTEQLWKATQNVLRDMFT